MAQQVLPGSFHAQNQKTAWSVLTCLCASPPSPSVHMRYAGVRIFLPILFGGTAQGGAGRHCSTFDLLVVRGGRWGRGKTKYSAATACVGPASSSWARRKAVLQHPATEAQMAHLWSSWLVGHRFDFCRAVLVGSGHPREGIKHV